MPEGSAAPARSAAHGGGRRLVHAAAERLRELILAQAPGAQIGSLPELAGQLQVGIVTVQQAARILEHEGLLEVRRGPGGGYFGVRPDDQALERAVAAYLRVHGAARLEVSAMMSLLDTELMPAAARCEDEVLRHELAGVLPRIEAGDSPEARIAVEEELRGIVFRMVERPLFELLGRVTAQLARRQDVRLLFPSAEDVALWKRARRQIVQAILDRDPGLAMFEAVRFRQAVVARSAAARGDAVDFDWAQVPGGLRDEQY